MKLGLSFFLCVFLSPPSLAQGQRTCTRDEEKTALTDVERLHTWGDVYHSFKQFSHCDDGAIAEGYSDKIVTLLARDWKHILELNRLSGGDKVFRAFVLRHIDETTSPDDLRTAAQNAHDRCPAAAKSLCIAIGKRIQESRKNLPST